MSLFQDAKAGAYKDIFLKSGQFLFSDFVAVIIRKIHIFMPVDHFTGHRLITA